MTTEVKPKEFILTSVFNKVMDAWLSGKRRAFLEGGTECSKTYSVMQLLKFILENYKEHLLATVTSESMPHLKAGAMRDFLNIMGDDLLDGQWNKTDFIYTFPKSECELEFVSADHESRFIGGRRDILFCNEVNHIKQLAFRQADMRTRLFTISDWNPESEFWFHDEKLADEVGNVYIHATYMDTLEIVTPEKRAEIEAWEHKDPNWWNVYGLGIPGKIEGQIHPNFEQIDELPLGAVVYGLDFGFSADPTVLTKNVIIGDKLYSQQVLWDNTGLTNGQIAQQMSLLKIINEPIGADPSEPKSIEEIRQKGFNIGEAVKGPGSKEFGIQKVNQYYQHWTKDSVDCIKEQRNYRWLKDRVTGLFTDKTTHQWSHGMDSRRYGVACYIPTSNVIQKPVSYL